MLKRKVGRLKTSCLLKVSSHLKAVFQGPVDVMLGDFWDMGRDRHQFQIRIIHQLRSGNPDDVWMIDIDRVCHQSC